MKNDLMRADFPCSKLKKLQEADKISEKVEYRLWATFHKHAG
jgi:hypothetical protein